MQPIQIYFPQKDNVSLKEIRVVGWDMYLIVANRAHIEHIEEVEQEAIYFLIGEDEKSEQSVYIGKTTKIKSRLKQHNVDIEKVFWNTAYIFVNCKEITIIENKAITGAKQAKLFNVHNSTKGEDFRANSIAENIADTYFSYINKIFEILNIEIFKSKTDLNTSGVIELYLIGDKYDARAYFTDDQKVVVRGGSKIRRDSTNAFTGWAKKTKSDFISDGLLVEQGNFYILQKDTEFKSPSSAASLIVGSPVNGWDYWKDDKKNTLNDIVRRNGK
mgnify:CR=1 FL=1